MRQLDSQVNDFMDSLIEESASLEPAPVAAAFSPPLSDKEKSKLRYYLSDFFKLHVQTFDTCTSCTVNQMMDIFCFPLGISGLLTAKGSFLSVAGLCWSELDVFTLTLTEVSRTSSHYIGTNYVFVSTVSFLR